MPDGVPATTITVIGKGETNLLISTGDSVPDPQNRRVEIVIWQALFYLGRGCHGRHSSQEPFDKVVGQPCRIK